MTLRHLHWMAESRQRREWDRAASVLAMLYNVNKDAKTRPARPEDFNPYVPKGRPMKMTMRAWMRTQGVKIEDKPAVLATGSTI